MSTLEAADHVAEAFFVFVGLMMVLGGGAFVITAGIRLALMVLKE